MRFIVHAIQCMIVVQTLQLKTIQLTMFASQWNLRKHLKGFHMIYCAKMQCLCFMLLQGIVVDSISI